MRRFARPLLLAAVLGGILRLVVAQGFVVLSESMEPTLLVGDSILVDKLAYGVRLPWGTDSRLGATVPQRGDVVLFAFHAASRPDFARHVAGDDREVLHLVKRVVAVAGDRVEMRGGRLLLDGREERVASAVIAVGEPGPDLAPVEVPPGMLFVLGDNRSRSTDSRQLGFVRQADVEGRAELVYWSWDRATSRVRWQRLGRRVR